MKTAKQIKKEVENYLFKKREQVNEIQNKVGDDEYDIWDSLQTMIDDAYTMISERELDWR